jgi:hypothetical protein
MKRATPANSHRVNAIAASVVKGEKRVAHSSSVCVCPDILNASFAVLVDRRVHAIGSAIGLDTPAAEAKVPRDVP